MSTPDQPNSGGGREADQSQAATATPAADDSQPVHQDERAATGADQSAEGTAGASDESKTTYELLQELRQLHQSARYPKNKGLALVDRVLGNVLALEAKADFGRAVQELRIDFQVHAAEVKAGIGGVMRSSAKTYASIAKGAAAAPNQQCPRPP